MEKNKDIQNFIDEKNKIIKEYINCSHDIAYYAERYCQVYDQTQSSFVPAKVFPRQKKLLTHLVENRYSIVLKPRQAGVSTVTALYCAHLILFAVKESPIKVLIVANKRDTAIEFLKKIKGYIETAPTWLGVTYKEGHNNKAEFSCTNGSGAKAVGTSTDALRGYTPNVLIFDEAAFIEGGDELWSGASASLSTGGRAIFISTPNGQDKLYFKTYDESLKGNNNFKIFDMFWWQDPRYNKDLSFVKENIFDTVDENGKKKREIIKETLIAPKKDNGDWDYDVVREYIAQGYEPTSKWFHDMCASYNWDERRIAQELKTVFSGSGDNVVNDKYILAQEVNVKLPTSTGFFDNNLHLWEEYDPACEYFIGSDVSKGSADDNSTIELWNMTTMEQAGEWVGKVPPDMLGEMINELGLPYKAYVIVDITGGMGEATILKLKELEYPYIHYTSKQDDNIIGAKKKIITDNTERIPGFVITTKNRTNIISCVEHAIRTKEIKIKSKRLLSEFKTFVYVNGRPDHMRGYHDDLIFALGLILYTWTYSFKELTNYREQTKKMLDAMIVTSNSRPTFQEEMRLIDENDDSWLLT